MIKLRYSTRPLAAAIIVALSLGYAATATAGDAKAVNAGVQDTPQTTTSTTSDKPVSAADATAKKRPQSAPKAQTTNLNAVTVTGVRGSEMRSVELKRDASSIQDSISAENIGQLPDVTIADSLQRITGVQIDRTAGVGSTVNVRGLPEVGTTINGESFITAGQIVSNQPDFSTIPSSLFAGADVIKSPTANLLNNGITGTINLRTRRPWDLKSGWTFAASADGARGDKTRKTEPEANGLIGFNAGGRWGALLSVSYSDVTRENSQNGMDQYGGQLFGENASSATSSSGFLGSFGSHPIPSDIHQLGGGNVDVNGDGTSNQAFYGSENFTALQRDLERKQTGINGSVQGDLGSGFTVTADGFFAHQKQYSRTNGYQFNSSNFNASQFVPLVSQDTGVTVNGPYADQEGWNQELYTTQVYKKYIGDYETYAEDDVTNSTSRNFNVDLKYDNGGPFTGDLRAINASAQSLLMQSYVQFTDADGSQWSNDPADAAPPGTYIYPADMGGNRVFNPNGLAPDSVPITADFRGTNWKAGIPASFQTFLADPNNYALKTTASENNVQQSTGMNIIRADGHYNFYDGINLDFGFRNSIRSASNVGFNLVAPVYAGDGASDPNGCLVHWKAADVVLDGGGVAGACTAGNSQGYYRAGVIAGLNPSQLPGLIKDNFKKYTNLAGVTGVTTYDLDPKVMDNPQAFQEALYPGEQRDINPGNTWDVLLKEKTAYLQADFKGDWGNLPYSGNLGVRAIHTILEVNQGTAGASQPYGLNPLNNGQVGTARAYTDWLPAANLALDLTPQLKMRVAYSKNMQPLSLEQWGGGLTLNYGLNTNTGVFQVLSGSSTGNPNLDPWRSSNYDLSLEYYLGNSSIISLDAFYIKVASFIENGSVQNCDLPDEDGVVRGNCVAITGPIQGKGNSLHGFEFNYQQAFTFLPGFLANTGANVNFTYSPSDSGKKDLAGNSIPFQDNSKESGNLVLYYQDDKFQARVAGNYRSKRAVSENFGGINGLETYQKSTIYLDASVSYALTPNVQLFLQGSNLGNEHERYYLTFPGQVGDTTEFERRYMAGVHVSF